MYIDPDTGYESATKPSPETRAAVRLATAPHVELSDQEKRIVKAYQQGVLSCEEAGRMLIDLKLSRERRGRMLPGRRPGHLDPRS